MDSLLDSVGSWADTLGNIAGKYLDYRRVAQQDSLQAQQLQYEQRARLMAQEQAQGQSWLMPALLIGGGLLLVLVLKK